MPARERRRGGSAPNTWPGSEDAPQPSGSRVLAGGGGTGSGGILSLSSRLWVFPAGVESSTSREKVVYCWLDSEGGNLLYLLLA